MIQLPLDFQEFLRLLNRKKVKYLVVGGYAVIFHGYVRYTGDLDIYVSLSKENAQVLSESLKEFGFDMPEVTPELFLNKGRIVRMGNEPVRLEIINEIDGVTFDECYVKRIEAELGTYKVNFIALAELVKNKRSTGRLKDLADAEALTNR